MIPLAKQGGTSHHQAVAQPQTQRIVPKPVPAAQAKDPRGYQIEQLRRRHFPEESTLQDGTTSLFFKMKPSDPDFPYDLAQLECDLRIPADYPEEAPTLLVKNRNIPKGFCINIENGWRKLIQEKRGATLLALTYALDRHLEEFLSEQKAETVTLLSFKDTRHLAAGEASTTTPASTAQPPAAPAPSQASPPPPPPRRAPIPEPSYSREQIAEAKARRAQETRQLEARMGRLALYRRSADGIVYTLPIEPKRRLELPLNLQAVKTLHMIVPLLYPLQSLRIQLNEVDSLEAEPLEELFTEKATENRQMTLMSHLNFLSQNMHVLAKTARASSAQKKAEAEAQSASPTTSREEPAEMLGKQPSSLDERSHIKVIPRPPEWSSPRGQGDDNEDDGDEDDDSYDSGDESDHSGGAEIDSDPMTMANGLTPERGIALSFPSMELHGIELLQVSVLGVSAKCARCKTVNEITGLRDEKEKTASCSKCAAGLAARFRPQLVHQNSTRAGFLDLAGATVADMLPSTFVPVCAKCSTPSHGLVSVRGETTTNVCRDCHGRFTFKIADVRFTAYAPGALVAPAAGNPRKRERLGLTAGEPLPGRGACCHYRKSYRWFRFSCCDRVHPCDRCHDEAEEHPNEWANRMVCGWCSREQRYAVDSCSFCGRSVIGRKGRGFWEGGKGTRDRKLMSRKDKRKYKRVGPSEGSKKD